MKKQTNFLFLVALLLISSFGISSCSSSSDKNIELLPEIHTESFDYDHVILSGPTSYGDNLYAEYKVVDPKYPLFTEHVATSNVQLNYGINKDPQGAYNLYNGGVAVSNWSIRENTKGQEGDWWYSYLNQCSVYNSKVESGSAKAAHSGENFALVTGSPVAGLAAITTVDENLFTFNSLWVANSAYTYGVMKNGNDFTKSLEESKGFFKLVVKAYGIEGKEPLASDEFYLADFREGKKVLIDQWSKFELVNISKHKACRLVFEFDGSDMGEWGLNTPTYACIDDLQYQTYFDEEVNQN